MIDTKRISYRKLTASAKDVRAYLRVEADAKHPYTLVAETEAEAIEEISEAKWAYFILLGDKTVGVMTYREEASKAGIYVSEIAIVRKHWGKGIGSAALKVLLKGTENYARHTLFTHPKNSAAIRTYLKTGFVIDSWHENKFGDGEPRLFLVRERP